MMSSLHLKIEVFMKKLRLCIKQSLNPEGISKRTIESTSEQQLLEFVFLKPLLSHLRTWEGVRDTKLVSVIHSCFRYPTR